MHPQNSCVGGVQGVVKGGFSASVAVVLSYRIPFSSSAPSHPSCETSRGLALSLAEKAPLREELAPLQEDRR